MVPVTPEQTARSLLLRFERQAKRDGDEIVLLRQRVRHVVPAVTREMGCRAFLFGSLAWGHPHPSSDVDIAVEGLASDKIDLLAARLMIDLHRVVEVVRLEDLPESFRERIRREGILLADDR